MTLPLNEQFRHEQWRRMILDAGPRDFESIQRIALTVLDYAICCRAFTMAQAAMMLPQQKAPASEDAEAIARLLDQDVKSSS